MALEESAKISLSLINQVYFEPTTSLHWNQLHAFQWVQVLYILAFFTAKLCISFVSLSKVAFPAVPKISAFFEQVSSDQLQKSEAKCSKAARGYFCYQIWGVSLMYQPEQSFVSPILNLLRKDADIKKRGIRHTLGHRSVKELGLFLNLDRCWGINTNALLLEASELLLFWANALSVSAEGFYLSLVSATPYLVCRQSEHLQSQNAANTTLLHTY